MERAYHVSAGSVIMSHSEFVYSRENVSEMSEMTRMPRQTGPMPQILLQEAMEDLQHRVLRPLGTTQLLVDLMKGLMDDLEEGRHTVVAARLVALVMDSGKMADTSQVLSTHA